MDNKGPEIKVFEKYNKTPENSKKSIEHKIGDIEKKEVPEQKYINICESIGENQEFLKKICKTFDIRLREGLSDNGIDFQAILEKNNLPTENLA